MKAYTDLKQSKKLAEILPVESADMWWNTEKHYPEFAKTYREYLGEQISPIPVWSLAALLDIFPCSKESPIVNLTRGGWNPSFTRHWFATWEDDNKNVIYSGDGITSVDAIVNLILKLHEQKLL